MLGIERQIEDIKDCRPRVNVRYAMAGSGARGDSVELGQSIWKAKLGHGAARQRRLLVLDAKVEGMLLGRWPAIERLRIEDKVELMQGKKAGMAACTTGVARTYEIGNYRVAFNSRPRNGRPKLDVEADLENIVNSTRGRAARRSTASRAPCRRAVCLSSFVHRVLV